MLAYYSRARALIKKKILKPEKCGQKKKNLRGIVNELISCEKKTAPFDFLLFK